ncbi:hypothetical protein ACWC24_18465 [Streptomyces sp. NPDC001443]
MIVDNFDEGFVRSCAQLVGDRLDDSGIRVAAEAIETRTERFAPALNG